MLINAKSLGFSSDDPPAPSPLQPKVEQFELPQLTSEDEELASKSLNDTAYVDLDSSEVQSLARQDLDFLAGLAMPDVYKYAFPDVYKSIWTWVLKYLFALRDFSQLAIGLPRGFGKTLVIKLIILYTILFTQRRFILVICENEAKAVSIISDVTDMLDEPNIKQVFGDWQIGIIFNQQAKKVFGFRGRNIILKAAGAGTGIRGITERNRRPDVMIFDDVQSREDSESELQSSNLEKWMVGTAMKAKSPEGCLYLFIANMYPTKGSLLRKLKANPGWIKFIAGGILANGESLWEDLQPLEQLLKEFQNDLHTGHPEIFYSEVLNDENASVNTAIDLSKVPDYPFQDNDIPTGRYVIIDPANNKIGSDATAIGYFEVHNGYASCRDLHEERMSPEASILKAIEFCLKYNCRLVVVESNAFQHSYLFWFEFVCTQRGIEGIQVRDIYSGSMTKSSRILIMFKQLVRGEIALHTSVRAQVFVQIMQFNPLKRDNVDGILDLLTYAPKVLEMYPGELAASDVIDAEEANTLTVQEHNHAF